MTLPFRESFEALERAWYVFAPKFLGSRWLRPKAQRTAVTITAEKPGLMLWGAGTPRTLRAHWMLHELGLPYEIQPIGSRTGETQAPEFAKLNPREKIPAL